MNVNAEAKNVLELSREGSMEWPDPDFDSFDLTSVKIDSEELTVPNEIEITACSSSSSTKRSASEMKFNKPVNCYSIYGRLGNKAYEV